ncbi:hypothetical protein [Nodularia sp. NIES-3585]|uniref:hypothetical protein n=1 Tax=Nodularia sp. NIES-3585 TaxID=1973477 RepID=UPI000B5CD68B|nr:hypothetical protein [Nodularia sp. NIES-3585]GAX34080.1 serine/threonine protein kinase with Chase2 sensor [Nodularia sp. NIES-3585]
MGISAMSAALLSVFGFGCVELMENSAFSGFFQLRASITPPVNMAILAIDGHLISIPEQYYKTEL